MVSVYTTQCYENCQLKTVGKRSKFKETWRKYH